VRGRAIVLLSCALAALAAFVPSAFADGVPVTPPTVSVPKPVPPTSTITASQATVNVGQTVTVTVSVQVNNIGDVNAFEFIDGIDPASFDVQSAQSDLGACTTRGSELQCPLGTINAGNVIGNTVVLTAKTPGTFKLTASEEGQSPSSLSLTVLATTADALVKVPAATLAPRVGRKARAGVWLVDNGPLPEHSTTLTLSLPPQVELVAATAQGGTCDLKRLTCKLGGVASGGQELSVLTFQGVKPGKGKVVAHGAGDVTDPSAANNVAAIAVSVPK
jgi:hypothetical protein